ncbi:MAG: SAM-dependent methyltransferase [Candidatus Marinimicrobia bacterium]|nr:SAM-dependent methyltransferase [Candidatus Neomarinimicrobiota bacterium]
MHKILSRISYFTFFIALCITGVSFAQEENSIHHRFEDAEKWADIFENPERDAWQKPDEVIRSLELPADAVIADIGSATGYFPVRFARVAVQGQVYGIDVEPTLVDYLNTRAKKENLPNMLSILGEPDDPKIPEKADLVFLCNTYHHIQGRDEYFENLKKYMQPGGRLVIVDFKKGDLPVGPPDKHKLAPDDVLLELKDVGYRRITHDLQLPYQYVLIFDLTDQ